MIRDTKWTPELKREYEEIFAQAQIRREFEGEIDRAVNLIASHLGDEYKRVSEKTGVPPFVIGVIHFRESSARFTRHLHNGDPLTARTVQVPSGRPPSGNPPFSWETSAIDALTMPAHALHKWADWSIGGMCYILEKFNGFGYRKFHNINSPYLWGYTTAYSSGLYVADGQWSHTAVNRNPGCIAMIKRMMERDIIGDAVGVIDETEREAAKDDLRKIQDILRISGRYTGTSDALFRKFSRAAFNDLLSDAGEPTTDQWEE